MCPWRYITINIPKYTERNTELCHIQHLELGNTNSTSNNSNLHVRIVTILLYFVGPFFDMGVALGARNPVFGWSDAPVSHETWIYLFLRQGVSMAIWGTRHKICFFGVGATTMAELSVCIRCHGRSKEMGNVRKLHAAE